MAKKFCVYKKVKDNIPGFRDSDIYLIQCFDNQGGVQVQELSIHISILKKKSNKIM
jgi:hypothetical protein